MAERIFEPLQDAFEKLIITYQRDTKKTIEQAGILAGTFEQLQRTFDPQISIQCSKFRESAGYAAIKEGMRFKELPEERLD